MSQFNSNDKKKILGQPSNVDLQRRLFIESHCIFRFLLYIVYTVQCTYSTYYTYSESFTIRGRTREYSINNLTKMTERSLYLQGVPENIRHTDFFTWYMRYCK